MSALDLDDKAFVAILAGTVAFFAATEWFGSSVDRAEASTARTYQIAALAEPAEPPHYAITYTFAPLSADCKVKKIAAKNAKKCEAEFNRAPISQVVQLKLPGTRYASLDR